MHDLNEHNALLRQATKHSKAPQDYHTQASPLTEEYMVHLLTVASNVIVWKGQRKPFDNIITQRRKSSERKLKMGFLFTCKAYVLTEKQLNFRTIIS